MKNKIMIVILALLVLPILNSCKKYLDVKPSSAYSTIATVADAQQLLNQPKLYTGYLPSNGVFSADDYYLTTSNYTIAKNLNVGQLYTWGKYPFLNDPSGQDWANPYSGILFCNTILDALSRMTINNADRQAADKTKGIALSYRGYYYWKLVGIYAKSYDQSTSTTDLGVPLRLGIELNEKLTRGTVQQTYDQIIKDLTTAIPLLPSFTNITSPSKASVNAILAEVYLSMRNYKQAALFADASLKIKNDLINYNALDGSSSAPIPVTKDNIEILSLCGTSAISFLSSRGSIDTMLYQSYKSNDLRKIYFFKKLANGTYQFSGNYSIRSYGLFSGLTTAEMYLTRAECLARQGKIADAMEDLNTLMKNRIVNTSSIPYVPYMAANADDALQLILQERRKELIFRDLRWMDIKRLNMEGANISLTRNVDGQVYTLSPNDKRFQLQLPESVIQLSGMEQNPY